MANGSTELWLMAIQLWLMAIQESCMQTLHHCGKSLNACKDISANSHTWSPSKTRCVEGKRVHSPSHERIVLKISFMVLVSVEMTSRPFFLSLKIL
jgi:hypothetical protein